MLPVRVAGLIDGDRLGQFSVDELTVYFARSVLGDLNLFSASRATWDGAFSMDVPLGSLNTTDREIEPAIDNDDRTIIFTRGIADPNLFVATRALPTDAFGTAVAVPGINSNAVDASPFLTSTALYFASGRDTTSRIYRSMRQSMGAFAGPNLVVELDFDAQQDHPVLTADERVIYFSSLRDMPGTPKGGLDIFMASRATTADTFGSLRRIDELSTVDLELPSWASPDHCRLYFIQAQGGVLKAYVASRR